ncbi:hypothetical protein OHA21_12680 [Actinoplanes sp. NBC_00393]|uniref:hypothetical protein n=1 Tax=Actinoplanes sp. NBC_00393 TaxID=2975953 RepID=UPI002E1C3244
MAEEDLWCYDELDAAQWSLRHVEQREQDDVFMAAASLSETLHARDTGGFEAVRDYMGFYGVSPEAPLDFPPEFAVEEITADEFELIWSAARAARESGWGVRPL